MSASLVGSEMCIRDSVDVGPGNEGVPVAGESVRPEDVAEDVGEEMDYLDCLLYTSDAADDM
eukprot:11619547-Alexandrium_andersonii.AAC.1